MIYLFEVNLSDTQFLRYALCKIYGFGQNQSIKFCKNLGLSANVKLVHLSKDQTTLITKALASLKIPLSYELKRFENFRLKSLISIKSNRGVRLTRGLPVRGQRTHTNARTARKRVKLNQQ